MQREIPEQEGNNHPTNSPMGVFDTLDGQVNLAASTNKMFTAFCEQMGVPELAADERFQTSKARVKHRHELWQIMNDLTGRQTTADLVIAMNEAGCPCGPIYNIGEAFEDEQAQHLRMERPVTHETLGTFNLVRSPINLGAVEPGDAFVRPGPEAGEHNDEVLAEFGLSASDIASLRDRNII